MASNFLYYDDAILYSKHSDDPVYFRWLERFLNASPSNAGVVIPDELPKTEREVMLIERAKKRANECMIFFNRSKLIDIPISMIYIVAPGEKKKYARLFLKGIVIERSNSDCFFAAKVFQGIFCRMCFSLIIIGENKNISYINAGSKVLKKGIASLLAREFVKESIADGIIDDGDSEECFDLDSEGVFNLFLKEFCLRNETLLKEECFKVFGGAVANGSVLSAMMSHKKLNSSELVVFDWTKIVG
jgi:hypothetical protein